MLKKVGCFLVALILMSSAWGQSKRSPSTPEERQRPITPIQKMEESSQFSNEDFFTVSVVKPTLPKDLQMHFRFSKKDQSNSGKIFIQGEYPFQGGNPWKPADGSDIVVMTGLAPVPSEGFKLIAYAPGCQLVTISVDDLASSNRRGKFECTPLNTIHFSGKANVSAFAGKALQVNVLYRCDCQAFFGARDTLATFSVGKAPIATDGSFTISLPDFAADPLWAANDGHLFFDLVDGAKGQHVAFMRPPPDLSPDGGPLKVAPSYREVDFTVSK